MSSKAEDCAELWVGDYTKIRAAEMMAGLDKLEVIDVCRLMAEWWVQDDESGVGLAEMLLLMHQGTKHVLDGHKKDRS